MQKATYASILLILLALSANLMGFAQPVRQTNSFNDGWTFHKGDVPNGDKSTVNEADWKPVDLPHDWSIEGPFDEQWASATGYLPGGIGWYRKTFELPSSMRSKTIFLYFDGVYKNSEVWINGHYLANDRMGLRPFNTRLRLTWPKQAKIAWLSK